MHTIPKDFPSVWVFSPPCAGINMMEGGAQGNVGAFQSSWRGRYIKARVCVSNPSNGRGWHPTTLICPPLVNWHLDLSESLSKEQSDVLLRWNGTITLAWHNLINLLCHETLCGTAVWKIPWQSGKKSKCWFPARWSLPLEDAQLMYQRTNRSCCQCHKSLCCCVMQIPRSYHVEHGWWNFMGFRWGTK